MEDDIALEVAHVSKRYRVGGAPRSNTFREAASGLLDHFRTPAAGKQRGEPTSPRHFWALRDVSFSVKKGEILGFLGANGAGKSTILKVLSRITAPTEGKVKIKGRVGSLLEAGTGFHLEFTGRENIYLYGSVLGMRKREIQARFDEIVDFAGVRPFLDTPLKRYSNGMQVRLAFSVAAHLEPDILMVDEVLAVGDADFQQKCMGRMQDVTNSDRTVLFVSHDLAAVEAICDRAIVLEKGQVAFDGPPKDAIGHYLRSRKTVFASSVDLSNHPNRTTRYGPVLRRVRVLDESNTPAASVQVGRPASFEIDLDPAELGTIVGGRVNVMIVDSLGRAATRFSSDSMISERLDISGPTVSRVQWDACWLRPGQYSLDLSVGDMDREYDAIDRAITFEVESADVYGTSRLEAQGPAWLPQGSWQIRGRPPSDSKN